MVTAAQIFGSRSLVFGLWCVDTPRISNLTQNEHDEYHQYILTVSRNFFGRNSADGSSPKSSVNIHWAERANFYVLVTCLWSSLFLDCKYKTRHTIPGTTVLCPYTSCLIIIDNGWMKKFSGYTVWILSLVYVLPSSTPSLVTQFLHWLCSDYFPFLLTKYLVCFA